MFRLRTLGGLRLEGVTGELLKGRRKELVLLAWLAQRAPRPAHRAQLMDLLWGERDEERARHSLRQALLTLHRAVGAGLVIGPDTVVLEAGTVELDLTVFHAAVEEGRPRDAVALWAGDFLLRAEDAGGEAFRLWMESERERARRRLAEAFDGLVAEAESTKDRHSAVAWAERWAELLPSDERAWHRLVEALAAAGKVETARARHAEYVFRMRRDADLEPSPEFIDLGRRVAELDARASSAHHGRRSAALRSPAMVGRDASRAELEATWRGVMKGESAVVVVEGGPGMGKTRICDEFLRSLEATVPKPLLLRSRAKEERRSTAWAAVRELLDGLGTAPGLSGAANADLAKLSALVPAIRQRWPTLPEPSGDERSLRRATVEVIAAVAHEIPVLVFLDDPAVADAETQRLIVDLARERIAGVLVMTTVDVEADHTDAVSELTGLSDVRRLKLTPLAVTDFETLLSSMLEPQPAERGSLASRLHAETGGNPLHAVEIVNTMVDAGLLVPGVRGGWRLEPSLTNEALPLPASVAEAARKRLDALTGEARALAWIAAALDEPFQRAGLKTATALPPARFQVAFDELLRRRILRHDPAAPDSLRFALPVVRRVARAHSGEHDVPAGWHRFNRRSRIALGGGVIAACLVLVSVLASRSAEPPTLAVGQFIPMNGLDTVTAAVLTDMVATNLARVPGLDVLSNTRMLELEAQLAETPGGSVTSAHAALRAGRDEVIRGNVQRLVGGPLLIELRRADLRSGKVVHADSIVAADIFELADLATARIARSLNASAADLRIADVTTTSLPAYQAYVQGLRALGSDPRKALGSFEAALAEDPAFAMAAFYTAVTAAHLGSAISVATYGRLDSLSARAAQRERLLIRGTAGFALNDPAFLAAAESLAARYPAEPAGQLMLGQARLHSGDFTGALPLLQRVLSMDSLGVRRPGIFHWADHALLATAVAYTLADSFPAAERFAREWIRSQPDDRDAWTWLGVILAALGRFEDGLAALRTADAASQPDAANGAIFTHMLNIRAGSFASADSGLEYIGRTGTRELQDRALWFLIISQRAQGRLREAFASILERNRLVPADTYAHRLLRGQVLFESGRFPEAARVFDSLAAFPPAQAIRGRIARHKSWMLIHLATVHSAAGDLAALRAVLEPLRAWGVRSAYGRDWRLYHHANGLLLAAEGRYEEAAAEFRRAIYSTTLGYTRSNYELARTLLALDRPDEAVAVLEPALRGALDASNLYITRTELRELLGRAHEAAGRSDSAAVHYRAVLEAWRHADPSFHARRDSIRGRLSALEMSGNEAR